MKFYDLRHPLTGTVYRLSSRLLMIPGLGDSRERVLVPMHDGTDGRRLPLVTEAEPIIKALPGDPVYHPASVTRHKLLQKGWTPAD